MPVVINGTTGVSGVAGSASTPALIGSDADSGYYINSANEPNASVNGTAVWNAASNFGFKNRLINGSMMIDQRNAGASVSVSTDSLNYSIDRWKVGANGGGVFSAQQSTTAPTGFKNSLLITVTTVDSSIAATDYYNVQQRIEGFNVADFNLGSASAVTFTISFWVRSSLTGTFGGSLYNSSANRAYPFTYTISSANTFEYKTVTVAGDTTGTWTTDNSAGLTVNFSLGAGSTYLASAGSWTGALEFGATGQTNLIATNGATFYIAGVQLEKGSTATSFDFRSYGTELSLCQRYFCSSYTTGVTPGNGAQNIRSGLATVYNSNEADSNVYYFPVTMRAAPTMTYYRPSFIATDGRWGIYGPTNGWSTGYIPATQVANTRYLIVSFGSLSGATNNNSYIVSGDWTASAEL